MKGSNSQAAGSAQTCASDVAAVSRALGYGPAAYSDPQDSGLGMALWQLSDREEHIGKLHSHVVGINLRGDAFQEMIVDGRSVWREPARGLIAIKRIGEATGWRFRGSIEMLHFYLRPDQLPGAFRAKTLGHPFRDPALLECGTTLAMSLRRGENGNHLRPLMNSFMSQLTKSYANARVEPASGCAGVLSSLSRRKVTEIIRENIGGKLASDRLSSALGLSTGHFNRAFKGSFGMSPKQYIIERRLDLAIDLLERTDMDVGLIAQATGFNSASHFGMHFKRRIGISPSQYRNRGNNHGPVRLI